MSQINPYIVFNGNCREAMEFYRQCLGGELSLQTIGESPMSEEWPNEMQENILHATLISGHMILLASDMAAGHECETAGEGQMMLSLTCSTEAEILKYADLLSSGGMITRPLHEFFGGIIGALKDKFGINWLVYHDKNGSTPIN